jgi:hypothetical protein
VICSLLFSKEILGIEELYDISSLLTFLPIVCYCYM